LIEALMAEPKQTAEIQPQGYTYEDAAETAAHGYLIPGLMRELERLRLPVDKKRIFDLGCGNGATADYLTRRGFTVTGVDPSEEGIAQAKKAFPNLNLHLGSAYDDLASIYGQFPAVVSLEVVEHVYFPRKYAKGLYDLVEPGGTAIVSTPYHGYWKNLAMALTGTLDKHFTVLWNHGHIKFWSIRTLTQLLSETGFRDIRFSRVGRIPVLAKSMIAIARK
jgi:2-polyprenyl-6-hydroxyphenyl methylase/3-demethylubiquinone-9 3-methyltransferase